MHKPHAAADPRSQSETAAQPKIIAAVDLGSNSFHMIVGELRHGQLAIIDRIRESVRLAEGLSANGDLSDDARQRAIDCLSRFGERLRDMHAASVRAAGTSTLRLAREDTGFMADAERALGHPIEVISGIEEARLVYSGVSHSLPLTEGMRLVCDIGGGSTEVILGQASTPKALESLHMGCVSMTEQFFPKGEISATAFKKARMAARLELRPVKESFRDGVDIEAIGTSGTIRATEQVAQSLGLISTGVTLDSIEALISRVLAFSNVSEIDLKGLSERRAQVWPGGLAILAELLAALHIREMRISEGALREGLLYDLLGRLQHDEDARERTIRAMASRYQVDSGQSERVAMTAMALYAQAMGVVGIGGDLAGKVLIWAAQLHEIGLDISHDGYQRHGAYIAKNADMPGFPRAEQRLLAFLIGGQRLRIDLSNLESLPKSWRENSLKLLVYLRLAVLLNRNRRKSELPGIAVTIEKQKVSLRFDSNWLADNPLTIADLEREQQFLGGVSIALAFE